MKRTEDSQFANANNLNKPTEIGADKTIRYRCDICDIWANSEDHLKNHLEGKSHKKRLSQVQSGVVASPGEPSWFTCDICDKKVNSRKQLEIHKKSHEYQRRGRQLSGSSEASSSSVSDITAHMLYSRENHALTPLDKLTTLSISREATNNLNIPADKEKISNEKSLERFYSCNSNPEYCESSPDVAVQEDLNSSLRQRISSHSTDDPDETPPMKVWTPDMTMKHENDTRERKMSALLSSKSMNQSNTSPDLEASLRSLAKDLSMACQPINQRDMAISENKNGFYCNLCKLPLTGIKPKEQHEVSSRHGKNLALQLSRSESQLINEINDNFIVSLTGRGTCLSSDSANNDLFVSDSRNKKESNPFPHHHSYCKVCNVPFTSERNQEAHMKGRMHKTLAKLSEKAPWRELPEIIKDAKVEDEGFDLTESTPRFYQFELFIKAMQFDAVCFLPTGTGKTLTSIMIMSYMLKLNPLRPVVFLVDRVLLVLQQSKYIERELQGRKFQRFDHESGQLCSRHPLIAALCGRQQDVGGHAVPLWKHDIIVSTAAYFKNLLAAGQLRWSDMSLVVLDEVHHCIKEHPYNILLREYHNTLPHQSRPKILGLTASPAGKKSIELTEIMLRELTENLGGARLVVVEEHKRDLKRHQSSADLIVREVTMNSEEEKLLLEFKSYLQSCHEELRDMISFDVEADEEDIQKFVDFLLRNVKNAKKESNQEFDADLLWHVVVICKACLSLLECGVEAALEELQCLIDDENLGSFSKMIKDRDLQCFQLMRQAAKYELTPRNDAEISSIPDMGPAVATLLNEIHHQIDWQEKMKEGTAPPMVLVLVKERVTSKLLERFLHADIVLRQHGVKITRITGHGTAEDGMTVSRQKRILEDIRKRLYQVIVATSVAEEGLDLPECELVIEMDPPDTVTSLIQIRGRARKKNGRFVAICRKEGAKEKIDDLLEKEKHMEEACRKILESQRSTAGYDK